MVRTAEKGARMTGGKAPRKNVPAHGSGNLSSSVSNDKYTGTHNHVHPQNTPQWQQKITSFFPRVEKSQDNGKDQQNTNELMDTMDCISLDTNVSDIQTISDGDLQTNSDGDQTISDGDLQTISDGDLQTNSDGDQTISDGDLQTISDGDLQTISDNSDNGSPECSNKENEQINDVDVARKVKRSVSPETPKRFAKRPKLWHPEMFKHFEDMEN